MECVNLYHHVSYHIYIIYIYINLYVDFSLFSNIKLYTIPGVTNYKTILYIIVNNINYEKSIHVCFSLKQGGVI